MDDLSKKAMTTEQPTAAPVDVAKKVPQGPVIAEHSLFSRFLNGLGRTINKLLAPSPPVVAKPFYPKPTFPPPAFIRSVSVTKKEILTWHNLVSKANGAEIVWGLLGFTTSQGDVYIARTLPPAEHEHNSSFGNTVHLANPRLEELCKWYFAAWQLWQAQGKVPNDVNFNFIGFGHCHPPGVTSLSTTDIQTILHALNQGMAVFVAPLCIMDYASEPVIFSSAPNLVNVKTAQELTLKVFTGVHGDGQKSPFTYRPQESDIVVTDHIPYNIPPTGWHVNAFDQLVQLQTYLQKYFITLSWTINADLNAELPYVNITIHQDAWINDILIRTPYNFPRSAPVVQVMPNDPEKWGTFTTVAGVWDGSSNILTIIDKIAEKGLL